MKKIFVIAGIICFCSSCDFSENCHYTGVVDLKIDKTHLDNETKNLNVLFYCEGNPALKFLVDGDTVISEINAGKNNLILINDLKDVSFEGMSKKESAQISLNTLTKGEKVYVNSSPLIFTDRKDIDVAPFDTVKVILKPVESEKKINFDFQVKGEGSAVKLAAELSGVQTKYSLSTMNALPSEAILPFDGTKTNHNVFTKSVYALGVNQKTGVKKILSIKLNLSDGITLSHDIDLTERLDSSSGAIIDCSIILTIKNADFNVIIQDWTSRDWGTINL